MAVLGKVNWESNLDTYTLPSVKQIASWKLLPITENSALCSVVTERGGRDGEPQEGGDICIHIADFLHCTAETNTTLESRKKKGKQLKGGKNTCQAERSMASLWEVPMETIFPIL